MKRRAEEIARERDRQRLVRYLSSINWELVNEHTLHRVSALAKLLINDEVQQEGEE